MKRIVLLICLFFVALVNAQDLQLIEKMRSSSLTDAKALATEVVNLSTIKYDFVKVIEGPEDLFVIFIPSGLSDQKKKELASNSYEEGVIFHFRVLKDKRVQLFEFVAEPDLMFSIVKKGFHNEASKNDFIELAKYRDYINKDKKLKFYFYSEDEKFRFYNYSEQL